MGETARFQETLRRLAIIDEGFVEDQARLGLGPAAASALDPKTVALLQVAVSVTLGSPAVCLEWSAGRALAAGASEDEIADVLLAIAPVAGLGRVVSAAPDVAAALGYDIAAALEEPDESPTAPQLVTPTRRRTGGGASPEAEDEQPGRQARVARREVSSGALAKEAGMATRDQPGGGWTVVLRRRLARIVEGRPEGGYTNTFEIICCDCGDHPYLDYSEVSPELQRTRGPYSMEAAVAAYEQHLGLHQQPEAAHRPETMTDAG
jgi:4-carboxymuconolactone decarboxylase